MKSNFNEIIITVFPTNGCYYFQVHERKRWVNLTREQDHREKVDINYFKRNAFTQI